MRNIRVGLIRCDTHGAYYAGLMNQFDLELLKNPLQCGGTEKMSWERGAIHSYFFKNVYNLNQMTVTSVPGFTITKVWDPEYKDAVCFSRVFKVEKICSTVEEVSDDVDLVFIADCNGEGKDHLELAAHGLKKGIPTFIDKPLAYDIADAVKLVRLALQHKTPLLSLSMLSEMPQAARFRRRLAEIEPLIAGSIMGCDSSFAGEIHSFSLAQNIFGAGVESVECIGEYNLANVLLHYAGKHGKKKPDVMVHCLREHGPWTWKSGLYAVACGGNGCISSEVMGDYEYPEGAVEILKKTRKMARTYKPVIPYNEMLELIAIAAAARKAQREKRTVKLSEVWKRNGRFD